MKNLMRISADELIVDNFAGGGGASRGIELALGRSPDIAVNHDPEALAMHEANHPLTRHLCGNVWDVDPRKVTRGRKVGLAWFSPDCRHFSKAKGGKPVDKKVRGLAWVVVRWARAVKPRVIMLENVEEIQDWGPIGDDGLPCPARRGLTFRRWVGQLRAQGYVVEWRELRACDFGAPTIRKRLFLIARCDGLPIVWPEPTHGPGRAHPYRTAAECIDWSLPCRSIFSRRRPLADKTLARIARGVQRFVLEAAEPFIVPVKSWGGGGNEPRSVHDLVRTVTGSKRGEYAIVSPTLIQTGYGERPGQSPRVPGLHQPLGTVVAGGCKHALVAAFLARHYTERRAGEVQGRALGAPLSTVTTTDHHSIVAAHLAPAPWSGDRSAEVRAFLTRFNGVGEGQGARRPLGTVTTKDRFGLVTVAGDDYVIADIGLRMLAPRELFRAQGFDDGYIIDPIIDGKRLSGTAQVRMCGNSVCPPVVQAIVEANFARSVRATRQMSLGIGSAA